MKLGGKYRVLDSGLLVPNVVTNEGGIFLFELALQAATHIASGGNFYMGLLDDTLVPDEGTVYADLVGEPTSTGGYARQAITRDSSGWPTIAVAGSMVRAVTDVVTFSASGSDYDRAICRLFLTDSPNAATPGTLISVSAEMTARTITPALPFAVDYELFQGS